MSKSATPHVHVSDALRGEPPVINGLATVNEALDIMRDSGSDALIIDKRSDDDEYGMISLAMIAREVIALRRNPERVSVYEVMVKPAVHLMVGMQTLYAIRLLCRLGVDTAIAVDNGKVVGCVSLRDLTLAEARGVVAESD